MRWWIIRYLTLLFSAYSARITLHHVHLAHAPGKVERAAECYRVAAHLARESGEERGDDRWVEIAAKAGGMAEALVGAAKKATVPRAFKQTTKQT